MTQKRKFKQFKKLKEGINKKILFKLYDKLSYIIK